MLKAIRRLFGDKGSGHVARERMQFVLMHDRLDLTPDVMECIRNDILNVLSRYMEIDRQSLQVDFKQEKDYAALISNVQVRRVYRREGLSNANNEA
jgi:cell division topological specificity factor